MLLCKEMTGLPVAIVRACATHRSDSAKFSEARLGAVAAMGTVRVVAVLLLMLLQLCTAAPSSAGEVRLTVLHTNDMHARFEETNQYSGKCNRTLERCYGGFARVANRVRHARREADAGRTAPVLFLNAGDTFQGSTWYKVFKWRIAAKFINILNPDAIVSIAFNPNTN